MWWWHGPHIFGWWMPGFGLMHILFWVLVAGLLVALARASRRHMAAGPPLGVRPNGLAILEERYAKGEIQRDEYLQKKADLGA